MNKTYITAILTVTGLLSVTSLAFSAGVIEQSMSNSEYETSKVGIATQLKSAKAHCRSVTGNRKELTEICVGNAERQENIAKANLEARYNPTEENRNEALAVKANAGGGYLSKAKEDGIHASHATAVDKKADMQRAADYAKTKNECNTLAAPAKVSCINNSEEQYNKEAALD
jgi:hypothetical protein